MADVDEEHFRNLGNDRAIISRPLIPGRRVEKRSNLNVNWMFNEQNTWCDVTKGVWLVSNMLGMFYSTDDKVIFF